MAAQAVFICLSAKCTLVLRNHLYRLDEHCPLLMLSSFSSRYILFQVDSFSSTVYFIASQMWLLGRMIPCMVGDSDGG